MKNDTPVDYDQPVAYDKNGQPLYARPAQPAAPAASHAVPQVVQLTRSLDPTPVKISEEALKRHEQSKIDHPQLNLTEGEYIINEVRRHPIGLVPPILVTAFLVLAILGGLMLYPALQANATGSVPSVDTLILPAVLLIVLVLLGGYIAIWVYLNNRFFLTNESVIQEIQTSLLARREQTVSLSNIEDASYRQTGLLETLFNFGTIRLSTEGDETTYRFYYVANPKKQIAVLNNAVEAFKNGRPVVND